MNKKIKLVIEIIAFIALLSALTIFYYFNQSSSNDQEQAADVGIIKVTYENFSEEVLNADKPVVLEFTSKSCPPCVAMLTTLIDIAKNNEDIKIGTIDMDDSINDKIITEYEVSATPTIIIFEDGNVKDTLIGAVSKNQIMDALGK